MAVFLNDAKWFGKRKTPVRFGEQGVSKNG